MTDKQRTIEFFNSLGVTPHPVKSYHDPDNEDILSISIKSENVTGYPNQSAEFVFRPDGTFVRIDMIE